MDTYDIKSYSDKELFDILDVNNPSDRELEAKILHMIWKYRNIGSESGNKLLRFFQDIYDHFFDTSEEQDQYDDNNIEGMETINITEDNKQKSNETVDPEPLNDSNQTYGKGTSSSTVENRGVQYSYGIDYSKDTLNPLLKQTVKRIISIDSQYRDDKSSFTTDFTFDLNNPLRDVVALRLYSVQIPYTWYTINSSFGSSFFYLKGNSSGINNGLHDISFSIPIGNYTAQTLVSAVDSTIQNVKTLPNFYDISFGNSGATYDNPSSIATIGFNISNVYNESYYTLDFNSWTPPNDISSSNITTYSGLSIPGFLGFNKPSYNPYVVYSNMATLPLTTSRSAQSNGTDYTVGIYSLTTSNNFFTIYEYLPNQNKPYEQSTYSSGNLDLSFNDYINDISYCTILQTIPITLSNLKVNNSYSRNQLFTEVNNQLMNNSSLYYSYFSRVDNSGVVFGDISSTNVFGYNYSHYEMYIRLNRYVSRYSLNAKIAVVFPNDTNIWKGSDSTFVFDKTSYELSNILSETISTQTNVIIQSSPYIYMKCISPYIGYDGSSNEITLNDYVISIPNSTVNGYIIDDYFKEINNSISVENNKSKNSSNPYGVFYTANTNVIDSQGIFTFNDDLTKQITKYEYYIDFTNTIISDLIDINKYVYDLSTNNVFTGVVSQEGAGYKINISNPIFVLNPKNNSPTRFLPNFVVYLNPNPAYSVKQNDKIYLYNTFDELVYDINSSFVSYLDANNDNVLTNTKLTYIIGNNIYTISLNIVISKYITQHIYKIKFVDPANQTPRIFPGGGSSVYIDNMNNWITVGTGNGNTIASNTVLNSSVNWKYVNSPFSIQGNGIYWDSSTIDPPPNQYNRTTPLWVSVGTGGNTIATSTDGISWNGSNYIFSNSNEQGLCVSKKQYSTYIKTITGSIFLKKGNSIYWNDTNKLWAAVGAGINTIAYSYDSINWYSDVDETTFTIQGNDILWKKEGSVTVYTNTSPFSIQGNGAYWYNEQGWGAVGQGGNTIATSIDGIHWKGNNDTFYDTPDISGQGNKIIWKPNGSATIINKSNSPFDIGGNTAYWNGTLWVGVGNSTNGNTIVYSTDGMNWNGVNSPFYTYGSSVYYGNNLWVATGSGGNTLAYSVNGRTWTGVTNSPFSSKAKKVIWNGTFWTAIGSGGNLVATSVDGKNWVGSSTYTDAIKMKSVNGIGWNGKEFLLLGEGVTTNYNIMYSIYNEYINGVYEVYWIKNSISFNNVINSYPFKNMANDVVWNPNYNCWIIVGNDSNNQIAYSYDSINWYSINNQSYTNINNNLDSIAIDTNNNIIIAGSSTENKYVISSDFSNWSPLDNPVFDVSINGIAYNDINNQWLSFGSHGNTIAYSKSTNVPGNIIGIEPWQTTSDIKKYTSPAEWYAVGQGGNTLAYSSDAISWNSVDLSPFTKSANGIEWNGQYLVAVGSGISNTIAYSYDDRVWYDIETNLFSNQGNGIIWNPYLNLWVAVGSGTNTIIYSSNAAKQWTRAKLTPFSISGNGIAWNGNTLVAVGSGGNTIAYSYDGDSWTGVSNSPFSVQGNSVDFSNNLWVATGSGGNTTAYSFDGIKWTGGQTQNTFLKKVNSISYNGNYWLSLGSGGNTIAISSNGYSSWKGLTYSSYYTSPAGWFAVGEGGNTLAYSVDASNWTHIVSPFDNSGNGISWNGNYFVAVGTGANTIAYSYDGFNWNGIGNNIFTSNGNKVSWDFSGNVWLAAGKGGNSIASSPDGINWTGYGTNIFTNEGISVLFSGNTYLATGSGGNTMAYSYNGKDWKNIVNTPFTIQGRKVGWDGNKWLAVGQGGNTIAYSYDGSYSWFSDNNNIFIDTPTEIGIGNGLGWNGSKWIALGQGGGNTVAYSTNGINNWNVVRTTLNITLHSDALWIVGGSETTGNTIATSPYGISDWTYTSVSPFSVSCNSVIWNGTFVVAAGQGGNTFAYSYDPTLEWYSISTTIDKSGNTIFYDSSNSIYIAGGYGKTHTIAYSRNISSGWTAVSSPFDNIKKFNNVYLNVGYVNGISSNGNMFIATGYSGDTINGNTIAYSYDCINWVGLGNSIFSSYGNSIIWKGNTWVATGKGSNSLAYSSDGINWIGDGYDISWNNPNNSWYNYLGLSQPVYDFTTNFYDVPNETYSQIKGEQYLGNEKLMVISNNNNSLRFTPVSVSNGGEGIYTSDLNNDIVIQVPFGSYTTSNLINTINSILSSNLSGCGYNLSNGTAFYQIKSVLPNGKQTYNTQLWCNINRNYTNSDYRVVFYDPYSFVRCYSGVKSVRNVTWDSTLGWILGFRSNTEYYLSKYNVNGTSYIKGDNVVSINLYKYFLIVIDDFNQNHLNDGLVTTTQKETDIPLPSYTTRATYKCDPTTGKLITSNVNSANPFNNLTQKQIYAAQEILNLKNNSLPSSTMNTNISNNLETSTGNKSYYSKGPFAKDVFGIIPLKVSTQNNNTDYIEFGGTLQNQERLYFGPVNIRRMSIQLLNDRGETVDLNGSNWSFSFVCEQLYQQKKT